MEQSENRPRPIVEESTEKLMKQVYPCPPHIVNTLVHGYWSLTDLTCNNNPCTDEDIEEPLSQWVDTVEILMNAHRGDPKLLIEANADRFLIICNRTGIIIHETMSLNNDAWAEDASEGLSAEDGDFIMAQDEAEQMPADYWHGEMKAEADAERQADAAYELAAELASCDWEGWN